MTSEGEKIIVMTSILKQNNYKYIHGNIYNSYAQEHLRTHTHIHTHKR